MLFIADMKKFLFSIFVFTFFLTITPIIHAQTPPVATSPTGTTVQSDFAKDLQSGEQATANDKEAKQNQKDEKDSENIGVNEEGQAQNQQQSVDGQDMNESQDNLNQQEDNNSGSQTDGEKKDDVKNGNQ